MKLSELITGDETPSELEEKLFSRPFDINDADLPVLGYLAYFGEQRVPDSGIKIPHPKLNVTLLAYAYGQFFGKEGPHNELKEFLLDYCRNWTSDLPVKRFSGTALRFRKCLDEVYDIGERVTRIDESILRGKYFEKVWEEMQRRHRELKAREESGEYAIKIEIPEPTSKHFALAITHQTWPLNTLYCSFPIQEEEK